MTNTEHPDDDLDLRPILGVIARSWQRIHPADLTADEAFALLTVFMGIENRLDERDRAPDVTEVRTKLRLVASDPDGDEPW